MKGRLFLGVAGGTGSGKSTIARAVAGEFPPHEVTLIQHDSYYRDHPNLAPEVRAQLNFDHPDALETDLMVRHLEKLRTGEAVNVPAYDFATHRRRTETRRIEPTPIVIVEGILIFVDEHLRNLLDIRVFIDTDADIRILRRVRRDMQSRNRTLESIEEQYFQTVRPMHLQFVEPSKRFAHVVVPEGGENYVAIDLIVRKLRQFLDS